MPWAICQYAIVLGFSNQAFLPSEGFHDLNLQRSYRIVIVYSKWVVLPPLAVWGCYTVGLNENYRVMTYIRIS